jgi:Fur family transcriptional regulator, peroxide stress response regulator
MNEAAATLTSSGIRMTVQRQLILEYLYTRLSHPSAEELYLSIYRDYPKEVSMPTIYKNLRVLTTLGLLQEFHLHHSAVARYDTNLTPHHHLVCQLCGKVTDLPQEAARPMLEGLGLPFQPSGMYLEISGSCSECGKAQAV